MRKTMTLAALAALAAAPAFAAPSPAFQAAILAELSAETRAEVQRRATAGNSVHEVLAVVLLNNMQLANAAGARVVAVDFGREVAVVEQGGQMRAVNFDSATLQIKR